MMNFEENRIEMGRNIKKYLALNGMNAQELANKLGVSKGTMSGWINGRYFPRIDYIERMSEIFGITKGELISGEEHSASTNLTYEEYFILECYRNSDEQTKEMTKRILKYEELLRKGVYKK